MNMSRLRARLEAYAERLPLFERLGLLVVLILLIIGTIAFVIVPLMHELIRRL